MKRKICLVLSIILLCTLLAGCTNPADKMRELIPFEVKESHTTADMF